MTESTKKPHDENVVNAHRLIAAVVYKMGKEHGVDPISIRCALAMNLVSVCAVSSPDGEVMALNDVSEAIATRKENR